MKFEKQIQPTPEEIKEAEKEMHMTGRAMRLNENLAEYKAERERSWLEKQSQQEISQPQNSEIQLQIKNSIHRISDLGIIKVYDKSEKLIFNGNPEQLMTFWKNEDYGTIEDISKISDENGSTVLNFNSENNHEFANRETTERLFQELESQIEQKKLEAQDQQKIISIRESLGQNILPPNPEDASQYSAQENKPEHPVRQENMFDDEKAKKVLEVTKDWIKFGGNFYDHLTGKNLRLEKGVDYEINPDNTPNMSSFRNARQQKIDTWLQNPSNQAWLKAGQKFEQDHQHELGFGQETVQVKQPDGSWIEKQRYTTPYFYENGWLYYESNCFDKQTGQLRQPEREQTKYRIYFNCEGEDILPTYQAVIEKLNQDKDLQKLGFQIKTADVSKIGPYEIGQIINQKDRIVLYLGEKGLEKALPILQKYGSENHQKFNKDGVLLAQPLIDKQGQIISGIRVTSETKGESPDPTESSKKYASFNDLQSKIIESSLRSLVTGLKNPKTLESIGEKYPDMKEALLKLPTNASTEDHIKTILSDTNGEEFLLKNLKIIYPQWAKSFGMSDVNIAFKK